MSQTVSNMMRTIAEGLRTPVIVLLLILLAVSVILLGSLIVELFTERRELKLNMPALVDELKDGKTGTAASIKKSGLILSQKKALIELTRHPELTTEMREALAVRLVEAESGRFEKRVMLSDLLAKIGPMLGLLGTLIPLGPGIIALGKGNTFELSQSLLTAFDTTVMGLVGAAICLIISTIRKRWYKDYMSILEALTECVLDVEAEKQEESVR